MWIIFITADDIGSLVLNIEPIRLLSNYFLVVVMFEP